MLFKTIFNIMLANSKINLLKGKNVSFLDLSLNSNVSCPLFDKNNFSFNFLSIVQFNGTVSENGDCKVNDLICKTNINQERLENICKKVFGKEFDLSLLK